MIASNLKTHSPGTGYGGHNTTRNQHGPHTSCALENHSAQSAGQNGVRGIVLPSEVADAGVEEVVGDGDHTGRVAEEGTTAGDGVENRVQTQLWRLVRRPPEALLQTPGSSYRQGRQVCDTGSVAEIIRKASGGEDGLAAGHIVQSGIFEREVFESVLVQTGQGV